MIVLAPDKFKGTLSAMEATEIISKALGPLDVIKAPMADGGEGTAAILCRDSVWSRGDVFFFDSHTMTAVIDSSAVIGLQMIDPSHHDILEDTSYKLGRKVKELLDAGARKVYIGVGGTSTCDGGLGFLEALGIDNLSAYSKSIVGLCDVAVPLLAPDGQPSALMFAPQKGATKQDMKVLRKRLSDVMDLFPGRTSPFDGAGGGLGFAIASAIGAECLFGAKYVLDSYGIEWSDVSLVITGEGKIDDQTGCGKVVDTVTKEALAHGVPTVAFGGIVSPGLETDKVISTSRYFPDKRLSPSTAALRLEAAVRDFIHHHKNDYS